MPKRITLTDVAKEAKVSLATASRAINGSETRKIRPDLKERVKQAADKLGYTPDANAQAMAKGHTDTVGLIVNDISDPYFSSIAAGVVKAADNAGLTMSLVSTQHEPRREGEYLRLLNRQRVRAIIIAGGRWEENSIASETDKSLDEYLRSGGSVALIGQPLLNISTVQIENASGASSLAEHMREQGFERAAILAGPPSHATARERTSAFIRRFAELGGKVKTTDVIHSAFTREGGEAAMVELLSKEKSYDVVFAVNDLMALGALAVARKNNLSVPKDFALAGFDDIPSLQDVVPSLTTVHIPLFEVGIAATELALRESDNIQMISVETELVIRDSTSKTS